MLYPWLSQKIWSKHQPQVVYLVGKRGKSMAASAVLTALRNSGMSITWLHQVRDLPQAACTLQKHSLLGAVWHQLIKKEPYPALLLVEATAAMNHAEAARLWPKASKTLVVLCPFADTYQESREVVEKYVRAELALFLDRAKDVHLVYDADVPHLADIVSDLEFGQQTAVAFNTVADIQALSVDVLADAPTNPDARWTGVVAKMRIGGSTLPFIAHGGVGQTHVRAAMYAVAVADQLGINPIDALQALRSYAPLPGRMVLIPGIKKTMLIDDSYDTDPYSLAHALQDVASLPLPKDKKRIAVLGDIVDVGVDSEAVHATVGESIAGMSYQAIVTIGEKSADILRGAQRGGMSDQVLFHFSDQVEAGKFVQKIIKKGDLVLVKGAASAKLESVVKELMAFPLKAKTDLLQR